MIGAVGVTRDVPQLLRKAGHFSTDVDIALARGWLWRQKIEGVWLYGTTDDAVDLGEQEVGAAALEVLADWLLGPMHPLSGYVAKNSMAPSISKNAVLAFLREMLRRELLNAIAILTNENQPYIVAFRPEDRDEIDREIAFMKSQLERKGKVSAAELPEPLVKRPFHAWRQLILQHGEYLGLGYMMSGVLVAWR